jgi:MFS family permease
VTSVLRRLVIDTRPLRDYPQYRRLWAGQTISLLGTQITLVVVPVQVYALTGSSFAVGLLGLVALIPLVASGLIGSTLVDAFDRRRLALGTSAGFTLASVVLLAQQQAHLRQVWLLYLVVAVQSGLAGIDSPARRAFIPRLLPADQVAPANALSQISYNVALTGGPLLAGLVLATAGVGAAYLLDVVSFAGSAYALLRLHPMPPGPGGMRPGVAATLDGFRFLGTQPVLMMTFGADIIAMIFGMPRALFPALAQQRFHAGPGAVGLLYAAVAAGALLGALGSGPLARIRRQGRAVLLAIAGWGLAIIGFGLTASLGPALIFLALAGVADMISAVFRSTILQQATPDGLQGRMQGVFIVVVAGGPRLGDLEAGGVATLAGLEFSVVSGGLAALAGIGLLAALVPSFRRYEARSPG